MFSGIIAAVGSIRERKRTGGSLRLAIEAPEPVAGAAPGESVAVNGVCLTVERVRPGGVLETTLSDRTERETNLGAARPGARVNLERALAVGDRVGGHFVYGHVDFTAPIAAMERRGDTAILRVRIPPAHRRYVVPRGSIALDGISLTVGETSGGVASMWLIPYTLSQTNLPFRRTGDLLNVEADMLARYVESFLRTDGTDDEEPDDELY